MRLQNKYLYYIVVLILLIVLDSSISVFATGTYGSADSVEGANNVNENASPYNPSRRKTGYLVYLTDAGGNLVPNYDIVLVPYSTAPDSTVIDSEIRTRLTGTLYSGTYQGTLSDATNGKFKNPPLGIDGYAGGVDFKNTMLEDNGSGTTDNMADFLNNVFGEGTDELFVANDWRCVCEAVVWSNLINGDSTQIAYTSKTIADLMNAGNTSSWGYLFKKRLPRSNFLERNKPMAGLTPPEDAGFSMRGSSGISYENLAKGEIGFGTVVLGADGDQIEKPPTEYATTDYLRANELNYYFGDFLAAGVDGRSYETYLDYLDMAQEMWWKKHDDSELKDDKWSIEEGVSSCIETFHGTDNILYRSSAGTYKTRTATKEFSKDAGKQYPGYGYMYSRALFGDDLIVCDYKGSGYANKDFIKNRLKLDVGHVLSDGFYLEENKEQKETETVVDGGGNSDSYVFTGKCTEKYTYLGQIGIDNKGTEDTSDDTPIYGPIEAEETHTSPTITYNLTHGIYKYTPLQFDSVTNPIAGLQIKKLGQINSPFGRKTAFTKSIYSSETENVSVIPEVKYTMYTGSTGGNWSDITPIEVYCMGEEERISTGSTIHGYTVSYGAIQSGVESNYSGAIPGMQGLSVVDAPLTGTAAFEWVNNFGNSNNQSYMQVCSQGSGFEVATINNPVITCTSFTLDLNDEDVSTTSVPFKPSEEWDNPDAMQSNKEFATAIMNNLGTEVMMGRFDKRGTRIGNLDKMTYDIAKSQLNQSSQVQYRLRVEDGALVASDVNRVKDEIKSAYGLDDSQANEIWDLWGIERQVLNMLETTNYPNNESGGKKGSPNKWYNEESACLVISKNTSVIQLGKLLINDKMDYGSSANQNANNFNNLGSDGYQCRFYFSLFFNNNTINVDGFYLDLSNNMYLIADDEIKGARFLISNITTNNWRK